MKYICSIIAFDDVDHACKEMESSVDDLSAKEVKALAGGQTTSSIVRTVRTPAADIVSRFGAIV